MFFNSIRISKAFYYISRTSAVPVSFMPHVISANRLTDGAVVYRTAAGGWTPEIGAAARLEADDDDALARARADEAVNLVVDVVRVETRADTSGLHAVTLRERIRATGPTVAYGHAAAGRG